MESDWMKASEEPCSECPWRLQNQGQRHPGGWYTLKNLRRLWNGLRSSRAPGMTCHPTDPNNPVPEGHKRPPEGAQKRECAGALVLVLRELKALEIAGDVREYKRQRPFGLTVPGIKFWLVIRGLYGGIPHVGGPPLPKVFKDDPEIGHPDFDRPVLRRSGDSENAAERQHVSG